MADNGEETAAGEKERSVRGSQELIEQEEAEVDEEAKQDIQGLKDIRQVASGVQEFVQEGDGEQEAAAVGDKEQEAEEVREQGEKPTEDGKEKAEVEDVAAYEEKVEHEYIDEENEATMEAREQENEMEEVQSDTLEPDIFSAARSKIVEEERVRGDTVEANEMLPEDHQRQGVTTPGSLVITVDSEPTGGQDIFVTGQDTTDKQMQRSELLENYYDAVAKRNKLQSHNFQVQSKLFEYYRKKKSADVDPDKNVGEYEQKYLKFLAQIEDLRKFDATKRDNYRAVIKETTERCMEKKSRADSERSQFIELKQSVVLHAINSQNGQPVPVADVEWYIDNELRKEQEVVHMRLENIKLKNKMKNNEQQIKLKEQVSEGLHLIDFEQLKIENQTYNEKIEERNVELLKLRKKISNTVMIITHLKEKLQFMQAENLEKNNDLKLVDATLAQRRDILSRTKQARDSLRIDNIKLHQKCGFLGNESLLKDFEEQKGENIKLQSKLDQLKLKHAELTVRCNDVRQRVEQARKSLV